MSFLQLADTYNPDKHKIAGYLVSEKLDGTRCFWDGGITRGIPTDQVPWASTTDPKTGQRKSKVKPIVHRAVVSLRQSDHGPGRFPERSAGVPAGR